MTVTRRWMLIVAIFLGSFVVMLDVSIVNVALPTIQHALKSDIAGLQWVVSAYTLCLSAFLLTAGALGDRYGRRRLWLLGMAIFVAGSVICATGLSMSVLIGGRVVQGIGGALLIPGPLSILSQAYPDPERRAHIIGAWSSFSGVSLITGPILGGVLIGHFGWPSIFLINLPVGALTLLLGFLSIPESADPAHTSLDPIGQILGVLGLGLFSYGLIRGGDAGWANAETAILLIGGTISLVAFLMVEGRITAPMLPIELFRIPAFSACILASFVIGFSAFSSAFFLSLYFQQVQGLSAEAAGLRLAPQFMALALVSPFSGSLAKRLGRWPTLVSGFTLLAVALLVMTIWTVDFPLVYALPALLCLGVGMGLTVPVTSSQAMAAAPKTRTGGASATINVARQTGLSVGIALIGAVMSTRSIHVLAGKLGSEELAARIAKSPATAAAIPNLPAAALAELPKALLAGFHWAAAIAGLAALFIAFCLLLVGARQTRTE